MIRRCQVSFWQFVHLTWESCSPPTTNPAACALVSLAFTCCQRFRVKTISARRSTAKQIGKNLGQKVFPSSLFPVPSLVFSERKNLARACAKWNCQLQTQYKADHLDCAYTKADIQTSARSPACTMQLPFQLPWNLSHSRVVANTPCVFTKRNLKVLKNIQNIQNMKLGTLKPTKLFMLDPGLGTQDAATPVCVVAGHLAVEGSLALNLPSINNPMWSCLVTES